MKKSLMRSPPVRIAIKFSLEAENRPGVLGAAFAVTCLLLRLAVLLLQHLQ